LNVFYIYGPTYAMIGREAENCCWCESAIDGRMGSVSTRSSISYYRRTKTDGPIANLVHRRRRRLKVN